MAGVRDQGPGGRMGQWATCRTDHAAHAKAHVRAGIADHPDGPRSIRRTNQIRGPRESPCGDGHADHPWSMDRAGRWRPRPPGHGPRTIWAGRRADPVHAVHGPRAHRHRAGLPKRTWSGAMRVFCQVGVGRFGVSFSPCERRVSGRFGVGRSCWLLVIALVIA